MNRKKRLKKGIESINEQILEHELKKAKALAQKNEGLVSYYNKEIDGLIKQKNKKKNTLNK
jgi:hypothetical protein